MNAIDRYLVTPPAANHVRNLPVRGNSILRRTHFLVTISYDLDFTRLTWLWRSNVKIRISIILYNEIIYSALMELSVYIRN